LPQGGPQGPLQKFLGKIWFFKNDFLTDLKILEVKAMFYYDDLLVLEEFWS